MEKKRVNIVIRVKKETRDALIRIAAERKIAGKSLSSQQAIVEKCIEDFIRKESKRV
jgi:hypothetical protein